MAGLIEIKINTSLQHKLWKISNLKSKSKSLMGVFKTIFPYPPRQQIKPDRYIYKKLVRQTPILTKGRFQKEKKVEFSTKRGFGLANFPLRTKIAQNTGNGLKCILRQTYFFQFFFWGGGRGAFQRYWVKIPHDKIPQRQNPP